MAPYSKPPRRLFRFVIKKNKTQELTITTNKEQPMSSEQKATTETIPHRDVNK